MTTVVIEGGPGTFRPALTVEDLRNPKRKSGFDHVARGQERPAGRFSAHVFGGPSRGNGSGSGQLWAGPRRATAEEAAQDYCDYVNGHATLRAPAPREYVDIERERGVVIQTSLRKQGFTDSQKRQVKQRDGGCVGKGRYGVCHNTQPIELCQVDHIDPDGLNAVSNGQTLCGNCHDWKTAVENGWWKP